MEKSDKMNAQIAFKILGLSKNTFPITIDMIKKCFKEKVKQYHPDNGGDENMMKDLNRARDFIIENINKINDSNKKPDIPSLSDADKKKIRVTSIMISQWKLCKNDQDKLELLRTYHDVYRQIVPSTSDLHDMFNSILRR